MKSILVNESYEDVGHLSSAAQTIEAELRMQCRSEVDLFERCNRLAVKFLLHDLPQEGPEPFTGSHMFLIGTYLSIVIRRCEAAFLLAVRGLSLEADTVTRSALEQTIVLGSFLEDPQRCLVDLDADDVFQKRKMLAPIVAREKKTPFLSSSDASILLNVQAQLDVLPPGAPLNLWEHAGYAGLKQFYDEMYRLLSTAAGHPTNAVSHRQMAWTAEVRTINFGPDPLVSVSLMHATHVLLVAIHYVSDRFGLKHIVESVQSMESELGNNGGR